MKKILLFALVAIALGSCTKETEDELNINEIKSQLSGPTGTLWALNKGFRNCDNIFKDETSIITLYPDGTYTTLGNSPCLWNVEVQANSVVYKQFLSLGNNEKIPIKISNGNFWVDIGNGNWTIAERRGTVSFQAPNISDIEGNVYQTVQIGSQRWMKQNLRSTVFNDSLPIPTPATQFDWNAITTSPAMAWYNNDPATYSTNNYGALYNYNTVATGKLCPVGWHVPSDEEWTTLEMLLGGSEVAGGKLKEVGSANWGSPNSGATDEVGFTALPGRYRADDGTFLTGGTAAFWWTSTPFSAASAWERNITTDFTNVERIDSNIDWGFSVRCIQD